MCCITSEHVSLLTVCVTDSFMLLRSCGPPFLRVLKPPPPVSFVGRLPTKADQITLSTPSQSCLKAKHPT